MGFDISQDKLYYSQLWAVFTSFGYILINGWIMLIRMKAFYSFWYIKTGCIQIVTMYTHGYLVEEC